MALRSDVSLGCRNITQTGRSCKTIPEISHILSLNPQQLVQSTAMPSPVAYVVVARVRFTVIGMGHQSSTIVEAELFSVQACPSLPASIVFISYFVCFSGCSFPSSLCLLTTTKGLTEATRRHFATLPLVSYTSILFPLRYRIPRKTLPTSTASEKF